MLSRQSEKNRVKMLFAATAFVLWKQMFGISKTTERLKSFLRD